jgi:hypothetical protein
MRGQPWGRLYETHHSTAYDAEEMSVEVERLINDSAVNNPRGIFEYLLGGKSSPQLLNVRIFSEDIKRAAYKRQTDRAKSHETSNCPLCAIGNNTNKMRIYTRDEMDADHVAAWSTGGRSELDNCEMLCITHNRAKGNR